MSMLYCVLPDEALSKVIVCRKICPLPVVIPEAISHNLDLEGDCDGGIEGGGL